MSSYLISHPLITPPLVMTPLGDATKATHVGNHSIHWGAVQGRPAQDFHHARMHSQPHRHHGTVFRRGYMPLLLLSSLLIYHSTPPSHLTPPYHSPHLLSPHPTHSNRPPHPLNYRPRTRTVNWFDGRRCRTSNASNCSVDCCTPLAAS